MVVYLQGQISLFLRTNSFQQSSLIAISRGSAGYHGTPLESVEKPPPYNAQPILFENVFRQRLIRCFVRNEIHFLSVSVFLSTDE